MGEVFLGVIAASVLVMAVIQVAAIVLAARAARQMMALTTKIEKDLRPVVAHLQSAAADAARSTALAAAQVERADRLVNDLTDRVERGVASVQHAVSGAGHLSGAWLSGLKTMIETYRDLREAPPTRRPAPVDEEDSLFIG
jgi:hypothetical protein